MKFLLTTCTTVGDEAIEDFAGTVGVIQREAIERFTSVAKESLVEQAEDWVRWMERNINDSSC